MLIETRGLLRRAVLAHRNSVQAAFSRFVESGIISEPLPIALAMDWDMQFSQVIFKNLRRRSTRTVMTVVGLAVAVTAVTTLWNIAWGYAESAGNFYASRGTDIVVVRAGISNRLTSSLRHDLLDRLAKVPGVESVDGSLTEMVSLGESHLIGIPLRGLELDGSAMEQLSIGEGRALQADESGAVLLGSGIAEALQKRVGQQVEIEGTDFRVVGIFQATNPFDSNSIVAPLGAVQQLMDRPQVISEIQVRVEDSMRDEIALDQVCRSIEVLSDPQGQLLGLKAQRTQQFVDSATEATLGKGMAWATTAIVLSLSLIGMLNTMLMSVIERTREVGILRAIGWKRMRIIRMILGESFLISVMAAVVGLATAWLLLQLLSYWSRTSLLVPQGLSSMAMAIGFVAAIFAGVAGSFYPAWHASNISPVEALRHE
jgi:putative ABC transport system permease protein